MALSQTLELRQGQSLVMTPQLQQAIKLLQMSNLELQSFIESELERNPVLERDENSEPLETDADRRVDESSRVTESEDYRAHDVAETISDPTTTGERLESLDADLGTVYSEDSPSDMANLQLQAPASSVWTGIGSGGSGSGEAPDFENMVADERTLSDHVSEQASITLAGPADRLIAAHLTGLLNEAGYLAGDTVGVAETLGADIADVERVLAILQTFDPPGVFARDLKECLARQLMDLNRYDPAMQALISNLDLLAKRDFARLKRECDVELDDLKEMIEEVRSLNPKPGNSFGSVIVQAVVPDVIVRSARDGTWIVELNTETLPRLLVNNQYLAMVKASGSREQDKLYVSECYATATWLIRSLDQRARTILSVAREIVRQQDAFLVHGVQHLKPMNLKMVAEAISMHESTVSRVTSNKYIATPRGILEMRYFFTNAISATGHDDAHSAEAVRHRIRELIESESASQVLSDDGLVEALQREGIEIARRTVAKYRESLGIASSVQRRRERRAYG